MIIGITGTLGAGKGTVADYLVKNCGFTSYSARDFYTEEIKRRGLPVNRDTMTETANHLRALHGPEYLAEQLMGRAAREGKDAVIESIRSVGEADFLHSRSALLWAVDAQLVTRYERIQKRGSATDKITFEKFVADEEREMHSSDPTKQNLAAVREMADHVFLNDGTPEELFAQVEAELKKVRVQ